jgi:hypothetical protein
MRILAALAAAVTALALAAPARADLLIQVDKSTQRMTVSADGEHLYTWPVSTGIAKYDTPNGAFTPFRKEKEHYSQEWDDAPMPYSIFFTMKGHAIHGTNHSNLGHAASHGCVRLSVANAAKLWDLVAKHKMAHTTVVLTGKVPAASEPPAVARVKPRHDVLRRDAEVLRGMQRDNGDNYQAYQGYRAYQNEEAAPLPPRGLDDAQRYREYRDYREARRGYGYDRGYQRPDYEDQPRGFFPFFGR